MNSYLARQQAALPIIFTFLSHYRRPYSLNNNWTLIIMKWKMFQSLFFKLYHSKPGDHNSMWDLFRKGKLDFDEELLSLIPDGKKEMFQKYLNEMNENKRKKLEEEDLSNNDDWMNLFVNLRDKGCKTLEEEETIDIVCSGLKKKMKLSSIEDTVIQEYGDIFSSQIAIPEVVIFNENKDDLKKNLKDGFHKTMDQKEKAKPKNSEESFHEIKQRVIKNINDSAKAQLLQDIRASEAEVHVQKMALQHAKEAKIPMIAFRGIQTFRDIGKHLEKFGVKLSKLSQLLKNSNDAELEAEHDIMLISCNGEKIQVTFIQVMLKILECSMSFTLCRLRLPNTRCLGRKI